MGILDWRLWLVGALSIAAGIAIGWLAWGRRIERQRSRYRAMLDDARRNWELVEGRLSAALDDLEILSARFARRGEELEALQQSVMRQSPTQHVPPPEKTTAGQQSASTYHAPGGPNGEAARASSPRRRGEDPKWTGAPAADDARAGRVTSGHG